MDKNFVLLNNGIKMPSIGFGTYKLGDNKQTSKIIKDAISQTQYRIIAIVNNEDSAVVSSALTRDGFTVTKLSTTGGFLMVGNTTFLIGAEDETVAKAKEIIKKNS